MKKMIIINGDPNGSGSMTDAVNEMIRIFNENEMEAEHYQIGHLPIHGCMDCGNCAERGRCVFEDDPVNELAEKLETADGLIVRGGKRLHGGEVDSFNDHRIAMSMAVAATVADGPVVIRGAEAVAKSYPAFWEDYEALGGQIVRGG